MTDIDVLIDPVDLKRTVEVVCDLGYHFAPHHVSRFAGHMHHLPAATMTNSGFRITLEIHVDAMSPDVPERSNFANLSARPTRFRRGPGPDGFGFRPYRYAAPHGPTYVRADAARAFDAFE